MRSRGDRHCAEASRAGACRATAQVIAFDMTRPYPSGALRVRPAAILPLSLRSASVSKMIALENCKSRKWVNPISRHCPGPSSPNWYVESVPILSDGSFNSESVIVIALIICKYLFTKISADKTGRLTTSPIKSMSRTTFEKHGNNTTRTRPSTGHNTKHCSRHNDGIGKACG